MTRLLRGLGVVTLVVAVGLGALVPVRETYVRTEIAGEVEQLSPESDGTYRFVFAPTLSDSEQTRLRGCLQDATVDRLQLKVVRVRRLPA